MKILLSPGGLEQSHGGVSRYVYELARGLNERGHRCQIAGKLVWNSYLTTKGQHLHRGLRIPKPRWGLGPLARALNRKFWADRSLVGGADVIHQTYYFDDVSGLSKKPIVLTVYDMIHELFPEQFRDASRLSAAKLAACNRASHIIAISDSTKRDLLRLFDLDPSQISVVPLAASMEHFSSARATTNLGPYLLHVGSRHGYKNFLSLLRAMENVDEFMRGDLQLVVFGGGPPSLEELRIIHALRLPKVKVRWLHGDDERLAQLYRGALALVYPSLYEGFGLPPLEAMQLGCPVIAGNNSSIPEVVSSAGVLVDTTDPLRLAEAINDLVLDRNRTSALMTRGRRQSRLFSWDTVAERTELVYQQVLR